MVGMMAMMLLLLLAATSFNAAIRWLGAKRWQWLHRFVYLAVCLGLLHFYWKRASKNNLDDVFVYGVIVALLLAWRVWHRWRGRMRKAT